MPNPHWAAPLIGRRYARLGRGPDAFDCWGLCLHVWRTRFSIEVPDVAIDPIDQDAVAAAFDNRGAAVGVRSERVDRPFEGVAVYMTSARLPHHIGLWLDVDGGGVIHATEPAVRFNARHTLKHAGWRILAYYRPTDLQCPQFTF